MADTANDPKLVSWDQVNRDWRGNLTDRGIAWPEPAEKAFFLALWQSVRDSRILAYAPASPSSSVAQPSHPWSGEADPGTPPIATFLRARNILEHARAAGLSPRALEALGDALADAADYSHAIGRGIAVFSAERARPGATGPQRIMAPQ